MSVGYLIGLLPEYEDRWVEITPDQTVKSIIREVINAHYEFTGHYDLIAPYFYADTTKQICANLYNFCKENLKYREEGDEDQTTAIPAGILIRGDSTGVDCKHYASFCGGVLDAINRLYDKNIKWCYRFASYRVFDKEPHHVFIVVNDNGGEIWIDPTPGADGRSPIWYEDHKIKKSMALRRNIAGVDDVALSVKNITEEQIQGALEEAGVVDIDADSNLSSEDFTAISTLLNFNVIDQYGNVSMVRMDELEGLLSADDYSNILDAYNYFLGRAQVGSFFGDIWRGVKVVAGSVPRNAYLSLVALNVFGMASKGLKILEYPDTKTELLDKWYSLGGSKSALEGTIRSGAKKKAILGSLDMNSIGFPPAAPAAAPAWLAIAAPILAVLVPLMSSLLKKKNAYDEFAYLDGQIPAQYGGSSGSIMDFFKNNPIVVIGGAALLAFILLKDK
jgi:hypothetical protein